jgi:hypothetical protein
MNSSFIHPGALFREDLMKMKLSNN